MNIDLIKSLEFQICDSAKYNVNLIYGDGLYYLQEIIDDGFFEMNFKNIDEEKYFQYLLYRDFKIVCDGKNKYEFDYDYFAELYMKQNKFKKITEEYIKENPLQLSNRNSDYIKISNMTKFIEAVLNRMENSKIQYHATLGWLKWTK